MRASTGGWPGGLAAAGDIAASATASAAQEISWQASSVAKQAELAGEASPAVSADVDELFGIESRDAKSLVSADWAIRSRGNGAFATPDQDRSSWPLTAGAPSACYTPTM